MTIAIATVSRESMTDQLIELLGCGITAAEVAPAIERLIARHGLTDIDLLIETEVQEAVAPAGSVPAMAQGRPIVTDCDIAVFVRRSLDDAEYDVDPIVREIIATYGAVDPEAIDGTEYWTIVTRHYLP